MIFARTGLAVLVVLGLMVPVAVWAKSRSAGECKVCHQAIYNDWAGSAHGQSWKDPLFQKRFKEMDRPQECVSCHAPKPINEKLLACGPVARKENRHEGVSCITCHAEGAVIHGPGTHTDGAHSCTNKSFRNPGLCAPCHSSSCLCFSNKKGNHARQLGDWVRSPYRTKATCQKCHMPLKSGRTANLRHPNLGIRNISDHSFPGARDIDFIRESVGFNIERQGDELLLTIMNENSGHSLPASEGRTILVRLVFLDENNLEIQHRLEEIDARHGNRIRSGSSKIYTYKIYDGFRRVRVSVMFRHHCEQPERHWYLLHHRIFDLQMEYALPPTGHIGDTLRQEIKDREIRRKIRQRPITVNEWGEEEHE